MDAKFEDQSYLYLYLYYSLFYLQPFYFPLFPFYLRNLIFLNFIKFFNDVLNGVISSSDSTNQYPPNFFNGSRDFQNFRPPICEGRAYSRN